MRMTRRGFLGALLAAPLVAAASRLKAKKQVAFQVGSGLGISPEALGEYDIARMARDFGRPIARLQMFPRGILDKIVRVEPL